MTRAEPANAWGRQTWSLLILLVAAISLPFLDKAFHIDDTFFLRISANILVDPLDAFAGVIDWGGVRRPVWQLASNPPFLSYYLAPFLALSGGSEVGLHAAMLPFLLLLAASTHWLAQRFTASPWLTTLFVMTSAGVGVSVNLMRDVPATALGVAAVAAVVAATDRRSSALLWCGFGLAGVALLTRFNAIVFVAAAISYPLLAGRARELWPAACFPFVLLIGWSLHNQLVYGETQLLAQLGRGHNRPFHAWRDNLASIALVVGSLLYLSPALLARALERRDRVALSVFAASVALLVLGLWGYLGRAADAQYWLWSVLGCALLCFALLEGARPRFASQRARGSDARFLLLWLGMQLAVVVLVAPFPAVRHLLPALVPLTILGLRYWEAAAESQALRALPAVLVALQASVSLAVAIADAQLAGSYRDFARRSAAEESAGGELWFVGHWGWLYYAEAAGLKQLHSAGAGPSPGDRLIIPLQVDKGIALERRPQLRRSLRKLGQRAYESSVPLRSVHAAGAGFYALFSGRNTGSRPSLPYRWLPGSAVEVFEVYEVLPSAEVGR